MNVIWTYGNNNWDTEFKLTQLELITVFASITMWKYFYPESTTYLYCDESVKKYLTKVDLIQFWDVVDTSFLQEQDVYKRTAFWTIDKIRLFQHIKTPFTFIDFDLYIKQRLPEYTSYDYMVAFTEDTKGYYPYYYDVGFKSLRFPKEFTFKDTAHNTCMFCVNNSDVSKQYTDMCLSYIKQINNIDIVHSGHSVFLEQTILYELSLINNWKTKSLVNKKFNVLNEIWTDVDCDGILSPSESEKYYRHLSNDKRRLKEYDTKTLLIKSEIIELTKKYNPTLLPHLFKLCQ
jgi:hypothetical protein